MKKSKSLLAREKMIEAIKGIMEDTDYKDIFVGTQLSKNPKYPAITITCLVRPIITFEAGIIDFNPITGSGTAITMDEVIYNIKSVSTNDEECITLLQLVIENLRAKFHALRMQSGIIKLLTDNMAIGNVEAQSSGENKIFECTTVLEGNWEQTERR